MRMESPRLPFNRSHELVECQPTTKCTPVIAVILSSWNRPECIAEEIPERVKPCSFKRFELLPNISEYLVRAVRIKERILGLFGAVEISGIPILYRIHSFKLPFLVEIVMDSSPDKNIKERFKIMSIQMRWGVVIQEFTRHIRHCSRAMIGSRCRNLSSVVYFG